MFLKIYFKIVNFLCIAIVLLLYLIFKVCFRENKKAKFYFNYFIFYFALILSGLGLLLPLLVYRPMDPAFVTYISPFNIYLTENIMHIKITIRNVERINYDIPCVVVQNHQSALEMLVNLNIWPTVKRILSVSKKEVKYLFPLGIIYNLTGSVLLSKNNSSKAYEELKSVGVVTKRTKSKVWMYPEGTRNRYNKETLLPFKKGAFIVAVSNQLPMIPVVASPYYFIDYKNKTFDKGEIVLQALDPIPTTGLSIEDVPELMDKVRQLMLEEYKKLYDEFLPNGILENNEKSQLNAKDK